MKLEIRKEILLEGINLVQKAIPTRTTMPILKCILLETNGDRLRLTGNDLQIGIETSIDAKIHIQGKVLIDSQLFGDIIRNIHDEYILITLENNIVKVECNNLSLTLKGFNTDEYPCINDINENYCVEIQENLISKMISETIFAVADTDFIQIINGVLFQIENNKILMAASDGYRFVKSECFFNNSVEISQKVVIPGNSLKEIKKIFDKNSNSLIKISMGENLIQFKKGNTIILTRLLQGEFIKYEKIIPSSYKTELKVNRKDLLEALEIASVFAEKSNRSIALRIANNEIEFFSNSEIGNLSKVIKVNQKGEDLEIAFNIRYLIEGIKTLEEDTIYFSFTNGSRSPGVIKSLYNSRYEYLLSPVLMNGIS